MSKVEKLDKLLLVKDVATNQYMPFDDRWTFNGDYEKPTFYPSMKINYGKCGGNKDIITHCFVREGKILYLSDCTHKMAGKTVECVPVKYGE